MKHTRVIGYDDPNIKSLLIDDDNLSERTKLENEYNESDALFQNLKHKQFFQKVDYIQYRNEIPKFIEERLPKNQQIYKDFILSIDNDTYNTQLLDSFVQEYNNFRYDTKNHIQYIDDSSGEGLRDEYLRILVNKGREQSYDKLDLITQGLLDRYMLFFNEHSIFLDNIMLRIRDCAVYEEELSDSTHDFWTQKEKIRSEKQYYLSLLGDFESYYIWCGIQYLYYLQEMINGAGAEYIDFYNLGSSLSRLTNLKVILDLLQEWKEE